MDVAVAWLPHALDARMRAADVVNIAQVFHRSAMSLACRTAAVRSIDAKEASGKTPCVMPRTRRGPIGSGAPRIWD
ncbi:MAG: hypothetical protein DIU56_015860, partial [Pseudomonadota bacterium]